MASATASGLMAVAYGKDGNLDKDALPAFKGNLCKWAKELLKISICENSFEPFLDIEELKGKGNG